MKQNIKKVGVAGLGAMGRVVAQALANGEINAMRLEAVSEIDVTHSFDVPNVDFTELSKRCDLICECLPASEVPSLTAAAFKDGTDVLLITSAAILLYPDILKQHKDSNSKLSIASGALSGIDGVKAMAASGQISEARIISTKPPRGFGMGDIAEKTLLFSGNALDAAKKYPANVNVAATLSIAGVGAENTQVEVWADPKAVGNSHEIIVKTPFSEISSRVCGRVSGDNPKTSMLAAYSVISSLNDMTSPVVIG